MGIVPGGYHLLIMYHDGERILVHRGGPADGMESAPPGTERRGGTGPPLTAPSIGPPSGDGVLAGVGSEGLFAP